MGVSLNGGTPETPQIIIFGRKTMVVGETYHFRKPPKYTRNMEQKAPLATLLSYGMLGCSIRGKWSQQTVGTQCEYKVSNMKFEHVPHLNITDSE